MNPIHAAFIKGLGDTDNTLLSGKCRLIRHFKKVPFERDSRIIGTCLYFSPYNIKTESIQWQTM